MYIYRERNIHVIMWGEQQEVEEKEKIAIANIIHKRKMTVFVPSLFLSSLFDTTASI